MSNKILLEIQTYDPHDCTTSGYDVTLYSDGSVAIETHSRWQGSRTGERWRSYDGYVDIAALADGDPDNDARAALVSAVDAFRAAYSDLARNWRHTRRGEIVR